MKISITAKLFLAVLATAALVAVAMGVAARLSFTRNFLGYLNEQAVKRMEAALPNVEEAYRRHGDWEFLRTNRAKWIALIRTVPGQELPAGTVADLGSGRPVSDLTGALLRLTLLDADRRVVSGYRDDDGDAAPVIERPVRVDGRTVGWITMLPFQGVTQAGEKRFQNAQLRASWAIGAVAVLLAAAIAWWIARGLLGPVQRVARATHQLAAGDYTTRVSVASHDEVGHLAADFNSLAHTLQRNEQMRRAFIADVSHELRTPLGVLHGELEAMEDGVRPLNAQAVKSLQAEVGTLNKLVSDLYDLSLADIGALTYRKADVDLNDLLVLTTGIFRERLAGAGLALDLRLPTPPAVVFADERRLQQLFNNLLENSCRYTDPGGTLRIEVRAPAGEPWVDIDVLDSSPGVEPDNLPRLFDRFYRTEASRNRTSGGAGLGLAICRSIVEAHGGSLTAMPSPMGGLWLSMRLPTGPA
jgi:two-component system sensor histidine kinase BaeS